MKYFISLCLIMSLTVQKLHACSCENPVDTFCESVNLDSEVVLARIDVIHSPDRMQIHILDVIHGDAFTVDTDVEVTGSAESGADCLLDLSIFQADQVALFDLASGQDGVFLYEACERNYITEEQIGEGNYETYLAELEACLMPLQTKDVQTQIAVRLFPNPTSDMLRIDIDETIESLQIYDANGRLHRDIKGSTSDIRTDGWKNGLYTVAIRLRNNRMVTRRVAVL